jgi:four helix bundle protein
MMYVSVKHLKCEVAMKYAEWEAQVPDSIKQDSLWKMVAYRRGLLLSDLAWFDVTRLIQDKRTVALADQLYRAVGSISANIAEGYSRGTGKDRARFYEYALGSARESRDWYYKARHLLEDEILDHRIAVLTEIMRLLLTTIPQQRRKQIRESSTIYGSNGSKRQCIEDNLQSGNPEQILPIPDPSKDN